MRGKDGANKQRMKKIKKKNFFDIYSHSFSHIQSLQNENKSRDNSHTQLPKPFPRKETNNEKKKRLISTQFNIKKIRRKEECIVAENFPNLGSFRENI